MDLEIPIEMELVLLQQSVLKKEAQHPDHVLEGRFLNILFSKIMPNFYRLGIMSIHKISMEYVQQRRRTR